MDILGSKKRKTKQAVSETLSEQFPKANFSYDFVDNLLLVTWVAGPSWFAVFEATNHLDCFHFLLSHNLDEDGFEAVLEKLVSEGAHRGDFEIIKEDGVSKELAIINPHGLIWEERMNYLQMAINVKHVNVENGEERVITQFN